jgi:hypothetical protein
MRKIQIIFSAAGLAVFLVFIATLSVGAHAKSEEAYATEEGATQVSQGTVTGASQSELDAVQRELAQEERLPD